jgi:hypothetical protein
MLLKLSIHPPSHHPIKATIIRNMNILLLLVAAANVAAYAEDMFPVRYRGKLRELLKEEFLSVDFSIPLPSYSGPRKSLSNDIKLEPEIIPQSFDKEVGQSDALGSPTPAGMRLSATNSSNLSLCDELLDCMEIITGAPVDFSGVEKVDFCDALLYIYQGNKGVTAVCHVALLLKNPCEDCGPSDVDIETIPTACLPKAAVVYADDSGDGTGYDFAVASIVGTFIRDGKRSRTDDDSVGIFITTGLGAARVAAAASEACGALEEVATAGVCIAVKVAAYGLLASLEIVNDQISFHDGGIDSSEIAATLENTENIIDQTCTITGMLDKLLCPFGNGGPPFTVLRQGCDTTDQDCNGVVDECAEDKVPPSLTLQTAIPDKPFKSTNEAHQFLQEHLIVSDDCAVEFVTDIVLLSDASCCNCEFKVTTADVRCASSTPSTATATTNFIVKVDIAGPVINCGFFIQQDPFHVSVGFDPCGDLPVPFPGENDPLHIDKRYVGYGPFDIGLWYQIEVRAILCSFHTQNSDSEKKLFIVSIIRIRKDVCDTGVLPVTVQVLSNEFTDQKNSWIVERNKLPNFVHMAKVYLSPTRYSHVMYGVSNQENMRNQFFADILD